MDSEALAFSHAEAHVDLGRIRSNLRAMHRHAGGSAVVAVVKANAYGHGSVEVARTLEEEGVAYLAVAQLSEALELRRAGIEGRIIVFGVPLRTEIGLFAEHDIDLVVASDTMVHQLADWPASRKLNVHLKADTGMHRLGLAPESVPDAVASLRDQDGVHLAGLWTHMASSDEASNNFTASQMKSFERLVHAFAKDFDHVHSAASSGVWNFRDLLMSPQKSMVRLGISLYGYLEDGDTSRSAGLQPALTFKSRVAQVRTVAAGEGVSYNLTWKAVEDTRVATVAAGYADGYSRILSNRASVGVRGQQYPVVGTVCMDMFMINLGHPDRAPDVAEEDEVVLFGDRGPSAFDVADWSSTIVYEVCTNIAARVRRTYGP
ncbi:MAG: alanine racemase [Rhodothermia bacterium]|nr:alanine racemase [Rhodothermia bacterium]